MMLDLSLILDFSFLLLAIYLFPGLPLGPTSSPHPSTPSQIAQGNHVDTPLPSPSLNQHLHPSPPSSIPRITITPSHSTPSVPVQPILRPRITHKRKSVSFSLSSMDDVLPPSEEKEARHRRPPTPWMKGPASPSELGLGMSSPMPSPMPVQAESQAAQRMYAGHGSLGVTVAEPVALMEEPEVTPGMMRKEEAVDSMIMKKNWVM